MILATRMMPPIFFKYCLPFSQVWRPIAFQVGYAVVGAPSEWLQFLGIVSVPGKWCAREQEYVVLLSADGVVANQLVELLYVGDHHVTFRTVDGALVAVDVYGMTCSVLVAQLLEHVEYGAHLFVAAREFCANKNSREQIMTICNICGAKVADISPTSMTMELSDTPDRIDTFEDMMRPFNILEVARTGVIALQRGGGKI